MRLSPFFRVKLSSETALNQLRPALLNWCLNFIIIVITNYKYKNKINKN